MELQGKVINFLGDSITEGHGVTDIVNCRYDNVIKRKAGLKAVNNYGIGGTRIAYQSKYSEWTEHDLYFCGRAAKMDTSADIIVVFGGTNDYGHGDAPFGELADNTPATFCGAVDYLMRRLKSCYPKAQLVFMTPARREGDLMPDTNENKLADAKPLKAYGDVIIKKGEEYNIPVLDLYEKLGINPNNPEEKEKYAPDGLHFNDEGQEIIADCLMQFLLDL